MILTATHITKTFTSPQKIKLLSDISLSLPAGASLAITGKSGEGKTTLLQILGTLEKADSGTLTIAGQTVTPSLAPTLRNQHIGFIFQSFNLLEDFTALENILMPLRIARKPASPAHALALLDAVGLTSRAHFPAKLLSGGEKQRIAIARALVTSPDLILADEPSGNLDHENAAAIHDLLFSLVRERKKTLVLATHDLDLAARCDQRMILCQGNLRNW